MTTTTEQRANASATGYGPIVALYAHVATRSREDTIERFISDCVEAAPGEHVGARTTYEAYKSWCMANALSPRFETRFGLEMKKRFAKDEDTRAYLDCRLTISEGQPARVQGDQP